MTDTIRHLQLPLTEKVARELELGEMVTVSGVLFTGRSRFHIRAVEQGIVPPIDFDAINCFFHVGPVMRQVGEEWQVVSCEPTSSIRFERYGGDVVRKLKLRALIGKTTMGPGTATALRDVGGVHLTKIGVCGNLLAPQVKAIRGVHFLDELGKTEATWLFEVERFGPFFVDIDSRGRNYFEELGEDAHDYARKALAASGVSPEFRFTEVDGRTEG